MSEIPAFPLSTPPVLTPQMRDALAELRAVYRAGPADAPGVVDVRAAGAKGDGSTDDTAAFTSAIAQAPDGGTVLVPFGKYRITRQIAISGKRLTLLGQAGATIVEGAPITGVEAAGAMILVSGAASSGSAVVGLACIGAETLANFAGAADERRCFVRADTATDVRLAELNIQNKTYGVVLANTEDAIVSDVTVRGFLTSSVGPTKRFSAGVLVDRGARNRITRVHAREVGTLILVGGTSSDGMITDCSGVLLKDNGVYISSGVGWTVSGVKIDQLSGTGGSGIKLRGVGNSAIGCTVSNATGAGGISVTGTGADDGLGYDGRSSAVVGNVLFKVERNGIITDVVEGRYARDCVIAQNTLADCATAGAPFYPLAIHGAGHRIINNTITGSGGDGLALVSGLPGQPAKTILVGGNQWRGPCTNGLRLSSVEDCIVSGNTFADFVGQTIEVRAAKNTSIYGNVGGLINWDQAFKSEGGQCFGNAARLAGDTTGLDPIATFPPKR